jgi:hypothetical protein
MSDGVPEDIKQTWFPVIRRLQSVAHTNGLCIISFKVMVNSKGDPVQWSVPQATKLEPWDKPKPVLDLLNAFTE